MTYYNQYNNSLIIYIYLTKLLTLTKNEKYLSVYLLNFTAF